MYHNIKKNDEGFAFWRLENDSCTSYRHKNRMGFLDGKANCMTKHWREDTWVLLQKQHIKGKYLEAAVPEGLHYGCKQIRLNQLHPFRWCCCGCFQNLKKKKYGWAFSHVPEILSQASTGHFYRQAMAVVLKDLNEMDRTKHSMLLRNTQWNQRRA